MVSPLFPYTVVVCVVLDVVGLSHTLSGLAGRRGQGVWWTGVKTLRTPDTRLGDPEGPVPSPLLPRQSPVFLWTTTACVSNKVDTITRVPVRCTSEYLTCETCSHYDGFR